MQSSVPSASFNNGRCDAPWAAGYHISDLSAPQSHVHCALENIESFQGGYVHFGCHDLYQQPQIRTMTTDLSVIDIVKNEMQKSAVDEVGLADHFYM